MTETPLQLRLPYVVQCEFRTASAFLVAYSMSLSRGTLFLETEADVPSGAPIGVDLEIPGVAAPVELAGIVAWRRGADSPDGPAGIGIELADIAALGATIDQLVSHFRGIQILLLSGDRQDRTTLARLIKSIVTTAEVAQAADAEVAKTMLAPELDLVVLDLDFETDGALQTLRAARGVEPRVPTVAITASNMLREQARVDGADEIAANPPPFTELQVVLVRALSKPLVTRVLVNQSGPTPAPVPTTPSGGA
jgi:uncharacterized protein (TIGR02266 family)